MTGTAPAPPNPRTPSFGELQALMHPHLPQDLSRFDLHERVAQRSTEIRQTDPLSAALLAAAAVQLRRQAQNERSARSTPALRVRTLRELQPVLTALRQACIQEAALAALGPSAPGWLRGTDARTGASRLAASRESRSELTRLLDALRQENAPQRDEPRGN
ncbi:hypothetical protein IB227_10515 [Stenotrophomonas sp. STM01]|jgi:hypothetical protein|uniref:hypothetical protein n=1 Tax=unclassified Stenotrophomonas TaxID=196198 RepID=UPI001780BF31|nr:MULTISPECIES: hypothetical protein [unclassified Stenotrophomonas]MBD9536279.1 hypothetical protein [Stenotrophomonas sp. STM01]